MNDRNYDIKDLVINLNSHKEPITLDEFNINNFSLEFEENKHIILKFELALKNSKKFPMITDSDRELSKYYEASSVGSLMNQNRITLKLGQITYFSGNIKKISTYERLSGEKGISIEAASKSELMDRSKYYTAFQNYNIKYGDIINIILSRYKDFFKPVNFELKSEGERNYEKDFDENLKKGIIIQYGETDWEFLIRLVSQLGKAIINTTNGGILLGFEKSNTKKIILNSENCAEILNGINNNGEKFSEIITNDFLFSGEEIIKNDGTDLGAIVRGSIKIINDKFQGRYFLQNTEYKYKCIHNENIKGCVIEGTVRKVPFPGDKEVKPFYLTKEEEKEMEEKRKSILDEEERKNFDKEIKEKTGIAVMQVILAEGLGKTASSLFNNKIKNESLYDIVPKGISGEKRKESFIFPYSTPYSKTKTGFFCTPEIGDTVAVYFPTEDEHDAYVKGAVNNKYSIRFSNQFVRNYTTKKVMLEGEEKNGVGLLEGENLFEFYIENDNITVECRNRYEEYFHNKIVEGKILNEVKSEVKILVEGNRSIKSETDTTKTKVKTVTVAENSSEKINGNRNCHYGSETKTVDENLSINAKNYNIQTTVYNINKN